MKTRRNSFRAALAGPTALWLALCSPLVNGCACSDEPGVDASTEPPPDSATPPRDTGPPAPPRDDFRRLEDSSLAELAESIPTAYFAEAVDTSDWARFDVTSVGGTDPEGAADFTACANLDNTDDRSIDNAPALNCLVDGMGERATLYFPDGTYHFSGPGSSDTCGAACDVLRTSGGGGALSRRALVGQSRDGTILNLIREPDGDRPDTRPLRFMDGGESLFWDGEEVFEVSNVDYGDMGLDNPRYAASVQSWNGGAGGRRGDTIIPLPDTSRFTTVAGANGHWIRLTADRGGVQDESRRVYHSRVVEIDPDISVTIEHPLPDDFIGGNARAAAWVPSEEWAVRRMTLQYDEDIHHATYYSSLLDLRNVARSELSEVNLVRAGRVAIHLTASADVLFSGNHIYGSVWDKGANGYAVVTQALSRGTIFDNYIRHVTGIAFGSGSQEVLAIFNHFADAEPNPRYDIDCEEDGNSNRCRIDPDVLAAHRAHGHPARLSCTDGDMDGLCDENTDVTVEDWEERGYLHCSQNIQDVVGMSGDTSCRGTPASVTYSCVEWHNAAASNTLFMRNYCEASVWYDDANGPGRHNFFFGNWFAVGDGRTFITAPGLAGEFHWRLFGGAPSGYERNDIWANNVFDGNFGTGASGFDVYGNGVQILDNVIRGECFDANVDGEDPDEGACTSRVSSEYPPGRNTVWRHNTVGADVHRDYDRLMPSLPGFDAWPTFGVTPTTEAPFVGPEMGDPNAQTGCLPAAQRFYGRCPRAE